MNRFFKGVALFVVIACVVWVAVLWRWQATARDMTTDDIVVYLGLLPLTVFAVALLGGWAWRSFSAREAERAANVAAVPVAAPAPAGDEKERHLTVQLLAARVLTAAGASASELLSSARAGEPRPALDAELRDDEGLPLLAARIAAVDGLALEQEAQEPLAGLRAHRPEWAGLPVPEHVWRAVAALREPLEQAVEALAPWAPRWAAVDASRPAAANDDGNIRVLLGWPAGWSDFEQELARTLAAGWLARLAAAVLPGARFTITAQALGGEDLVLRADQLMLALARAEQHAPLIVAACHSAIGAEAVAALEGSGQLFSARRPKGAIAAEAAAALVVAGADWPAAPDADAPVPHLHRPALLRRDKSIDAPGRVGPQTAVAAMCAALVGSRLEASAVTALVSDADQHTARAAECFAAAADVLPDLEPGDDVWTVGHVTGAIGGVAALVLVACAAERAHSGESPCLALTVGESFARLALVAVPAAPVDPLAAAAPAA